MGWGSSKDGKAGRAQELGGLEGGQAHDARVAAGDAADPQARVALDGVGAGLAHGLAAVDVATDLRGRERVEHHAGGRQGLPAARALAHRHGREHPVRTPRQVGQHPPRIGRVGWLAQDAAAQRDGGVGAQHGRGRQTTSLQARHGGFELERGDALHVARGRLVQVGGLQRLGVFVGVRQQQLEAHAPLGEQFAAARALRREIDEGALMLHSR